MGFNCSRSECNTTIGCAHRGPQGEWCWFGTWGNPTKTETDVRERNRQLEEALMALIDAVDAKDQAAIDRALFVGRGLTF